MPSGSVAPYPHLQFFDSDGDPLASGTLQTYAAGTTTPLETYSDSGLATANPTTITLNSAGRPAVSGSEVTIFLLPRAYKWVLKNSSGTTIWTADNLQPPSSANLEFEAVAGEALTANDLCYLSDGSGGSTAGRWNKFDADLGFYAGIFPELAFAVDGLDSGSTGTFRRGGIMDGFAGLVAGSHYYGSATAGLITLTAPTNARRVGQAISATTIVIGFSQSWTDRIGEHVCEGALTLTSGLPFTTADVTAATTIYFTPNGGNHVNLHDGSSQWKRYPFTELSIPVPATTNTMYDVFLYDNSGTLALELLAWTNITTRATAFTRQNGVPVKSGATSRLLLGSFCTTGVSGQTEDSHALRLLDSIYSPRLKPMRVLESTDTWTYATDTLRQARAQAANKIACVVSLPGRMIDVLVHAMWSSDNAGDNGSVAIGEDSTTARITGCLAPIVSTYIVGDLAALTASYRGYPAVGYHYYAWLERVGAGGTSTFYGDNGLSAVQSGISGWLG